MTIITLSLAYKSSKNIFFIISELNYILYSVCRIMHDTVLYPFVNIVICFFIQILFTLNKFKNMLLKCYQIRAVLLSLRINDILIRIFLN